MFGQSNMRIDEYAWNGQQALSVMKDGDLVLANIATSRAEDKLISSNFSFKLIDIFSSTETMILVFPLALFLLFILSNISTLGKAMKSFSRGFAGLFIKFEKFEDDQQPEYKSIPGHKNLVYSRTNNTGNCNSCGGNKWYGNMCEYCGSTTKLK